MDKQLEKDLYINKALSKKAGLKAGSSANFLPFFFVFLLGCGLISCNRGPDENRLAVDSFLEKEVEERIETYRKILFQQCRDKVLEEAGKIADSILITEARLERDTMNKPPKPEKPGKPELKKLKDSLRLDPLFRDTTTN